MEIVDVITNVGGLGACIFILAYLAKYAVDKVAPILEDLRDSMERNTLALTTLSERLMNHINTLEKGE